MDDNWDVIIVGAGPSGLGVGAQLAHAGKRVLVLEKEKTFGGRASTASQDGVTFDDGPHAPMMSGDLEKIYERIGKPAPVMGTQLKKTEVLHDGLRRARPGGSVGRRCPGCGEARGRALGRLRRQWLAA